MRRSASRAARYAAQAGLSSRKHGCKWHYKFGKSRNSISLPTRNQRLARNLPIGLSKLGLGFPFRDLHPPCFALVAFEKAQPSEAHQMLVELEAGNIAAPQRMGGKRGND